MDRYLEQEDGLSVAATKSCAAGAGMTLDFCGMTSSCQHHVRTQWLHESWENELHLEAQSVAAVGWVAGRSSSRQPPPSAR